MTSIVSVHQLVSNAIILDGGEEIDEEGDLPDSAQIAGEKHE